MGGFNDEQGGREVWKKVIGVCLLCAPVFHCGGILALVERGPIRLRSATAM